MIIAPIGFFGGGLPVHDTPTITSVDVTSSTELQVNFTASTAFNKAYLECYEDAGLTILNQTIEVTTFLGTNAGIIVGSSPPVLDPATQYWFRVKVKNDITSYSDWSNTGTGTTDSLRETVVIEGSTDGDLTNYQVLITVPFVSGMSADFSDLRFKDDDGTTPLDFWLDPNSVISSTTADFWVKVSFIAADPAQKTIYLYYGNPAAPNPSNGNGTFLLFDDFSPWAAPAFYSGFEKYASNPLLGRTQAWETGNQQDAKLIKVGGVYYMFYAGATGGNALNIGYATASGADYPLTWTKNAGNPVLTFGSQSGFDDNLVSAPLVIAMQNGSYRMYYHGNGTGGHDRAGVAFATAGGFPDTWTKYAGNPILDVGGSGAWDEGYLHNEIIIPAWESPDGLWHMMYGGGDASGTLWKGGHATSTDGLAWTKDPANPIFLPGSDSEFDSVSVHPVGQVINVGGVYCMPYQGHDGQTWRIGVATTTDFQTFTKSPMNPLLVEGLPGTWDGGSAENPGVVYDPLAGTLDLFYVATPTVGGAYQIGLARSTAAVSEFLNPSKWAPVNFYNDTGVLHWPQVVAGEAQITVDIDPMKYAILSRAAFNAAAIQGTFNTTGLPANFQQLCIGFGSDVTHYIEGQRIHVNADLIRAEHNINGVYGDSGGSAGSYNTGWIMVTRTGAVTNIYIKQNYGDAWTLLEGSIADTMTDLNAMLSVFDPATANFGNVLVRQFVSSEPTVISIT